MEPPSSVDSVVSGSVDYPVVFPPLAIAVCGGAELASPASQTELIKESWNLLCVVTPFRMPPVDMKCVRLIISVWSGQEPGPHIGQ